MLALEFLAGVGLHQAWHRGWLRAAWLCLPCGLALLAVQMALPTSADLRCFTWGLPALLIVAGALAVEGMGRLPSVPQLRWAGDASYSIYLTHLLVLDAVQPLLRSISAAMAVPLAVAACAAAGWAVHRGIERPTTRWLAGRPALRPPSPHPT